MTQLSTYKELWTFIIAMLPIVELRGALPYALAVGIHPALAIFLSIAGNMLPIPFILLFIRPIFTYLKKLNKLRAFIHRLEEKAFNKSDDVLKYNIIGLAIFVAIPLPGTGAWTGALIASLLDIRFKTSILSIGAGVIVASGLVSGAYYLIVSGVAPFLQWMIG